MTNYLTQTRRLKLWSRTGVHPTKWLSKAKVYKKCASFPKFKPRLKNQRRRKRNPKIWKINFVLIYRKICSWSTTKSSLLGMIIMTPWMEHITNFTSFVDAISMSMWRRCHLIGLKFMTFTPSSRLWVNFVLTIWETAESKEKYIIERRGRSTSWKGCPKPMEVLTNLQEGHLTSLRTIASLPLSFSTPIKWQVSKIRLW